jgi:MFS family permease
MRQLSVPGRLVSVLAGQPVALLLLSFGAGTLSSPVRALLPVYVEATLHRPPSFTATLLTVQLAVTGVFSLVGGAVADALGQRRAYLLGLVGVPLGATVFLAHAFWVLVPIVLGLGVTGALQNVGGGAYLMAGASRPRLARISALWRLGATLGGALGTAVLGPIADLWGFARAGVADLALGALLLAGAVRLLPEAPTAMRGATGHLGAVLASYVHVLRLRPVALLGTLRYCTTSLYGAVSLAVPLLVYRLSGSVTVASLYATMALVGPSIFQYTVGQFIDRHGPARPLRLLSLMVPLLGAMLALAAHNLAALCLLGVCANCVLWALSTAMPSLVRAVAGGPAEGRAYGANEMLWSAGMLTGTLLGGALVTPHPHLLFALLAVGNLGTVATAAALTAWLMPRPARP